jgi:hypothetical protein
MRAARTPNRRYASNRSIEGRTFTDRFTSSPMAALVGRTHSRGTNPGPFALSPTACRRPRSTIPHLSRNSPNSRAAFESPHWNPSRFCSRFRRIATCILDRAIPKDQSRRRRPTLRLPPSAARNVPIIKPPPLWSTFPSLRLVKQILHSRPWLALSPANNDRAHHNPASFIDMRTTVVRAATHG